MTTDLKVQLETEISSELDTLSSMTVGTDEYKITVESLSKLIDKVNDADKIDLEKKKQELSENMELDKWNKEKELNAFNKKNQLIAHGISIGAIIIPVLVTIWGTYKTLKFEETGTVTTIMGRGFIGKLLPKK